MAVEDKYTDTTQEADGRAASATSLAAKGAVGVAKLEVAAADDDGSVYRIYRNIPVTLVPGLLEVLINDAITDGTDYDLGIYRTSERGGAVLDKDLFADGLDFSSVGRSDGLTTVADANVGLNISELYEAVNGSALGESEVDVAFTANTVGSAAGGGRIAALFAQNQG